MTTPEIIDQIHELILEDRRISFQSIAEQLGISLSSLGPSFMKIWTCGSSPRSGSRNASKRLKNVDGVRRLSNIWNFFGAIQMISCRVRLVTMDETWLYHYDRETKQQFLEWRHSGSHRPKKFRVTKSAGKVLTSIFWGDQEGILFIDFLLKGPTTNPKYYSSLLVQLKDILKEKRRRKFTKAVLFLHGNAPAHRALATQQKLAYLAFHCLDHPPYSPYQAPSDYHLFPGLKKQLKCRHFSSVMVVIAAAETCLDGQILNFLGGDLKI